MCVGCVRWVWGEPKNLSVTRYSRQNTGLCFRPLCAFGHNTLALTIRACVRACVCACLPTVFIMSRRCRHVVVAVAVAAVAAVA
eukprot:COSAG04_NODE_12441_length_653_cov_0.714801_1_plen_83_part_01